MRVEFYGVLAEMAGGGQLDIPVGGAPTVQGVLDALQVQMPQLAEHLPRVACAVGDELVTRPETIDPDTTLVLLPPVSGG